MQRRTYLRGVAAAAAASTASLAGCLGDGSGSRTALDWMPTPDVFGEDGYRAFVTPPATVGEISDELSASTMAGYEQRVLGWQIASPEPSDVELYVQGTATISGEEGDAGFIAVEHDLETETLRSTLEEGQFQATGEYEGYEVYETENGLSARGLADGKLVAAAGPVGATPVVEGVVDTYEGGATRYEADDDAIADVVDAIETDGNFWVEGYQQVTNTIAGRGVFEGSVGRGYSITLDADTVEATRVEAFAGNSSVEESAVEEYTSSASLFANGEELDWEDDGRLLRIEWTMSPGDLSLEQLG